MVMVISLKQRIFAWNAIKLKRNLDPSSCACCWSISVPFRGPPRYNPRRRSALGWPSGIVGGYCGGGSAMGHMITSSATMIDLRTLTRLGMVGPPSPCPSEQPFSSASSSLSEGSSHRSHEDDISIVTGNECACVCDLTGTELGVRGREREHQLKGRKGQNATITARRATTTMELLWRDKVISEIKLNREISLNFTVQLNVHLFHVIQSESKWSPNWGTLRIELGYLEAVFHDCSLLFLDCHFRWYLFLSLNYFTTLLDAGSSSSSA